VCVVSELTRDEVEDCSDVPGGALTCSEVESRGAVDFLVVA